MQIQPTLTPPCSNVNFSNPFQGLLAKSEALFTQFETATQQDKLLLINHLKNAYHELLAIALTEQSIPVHTLNQTAARICYLYGRCLYGGDMKSCRNLFLITLIPSLIQMDLLGDDSFPSFQEYPHLDQLIGYFEKYASLATVIEYQLTSTNPKSFIEKALKLDSEQSFAVAVGLRWLGHACQNIESYSKPHYLPLFQAIYQHAQGILKSFNSLNTDWEVAQILYNSSRFIHYLEKPNDIKGALETLKNLEPYLAQENGSLRAQVLKTQILNITMIETDKIAVGTDEERKILKENCFKAASEARAIAVKTEGFDPFLKTLFLNNKISCALACLKIDCPVATVQEIEQWTQESLAIIQAEDYNHYYHILYLINAAKVALYCQKNDEALKHLKVAESVCGKFPDNIDVQEDLETIQMIQKQINDSSHT